MRDMKIKPMVEMFGPEVMLQHAEICDWALASAHARFGQNSRLSGQEGGF